MLIGIRLLIASVMVTGTLLMASAVVFRSIWWTVAAAAITVLFYPFISRRLWKLRSAQVQTTMASLGLTTE